MTAGRGPGHGTRQHQRQDSGRKECRLYRTERPENRSASGAGAATPPDARAVPTIRTACTCTEANLVPLAVATAGSTARNASAGYASGLREANVSAGQRTCHGLDTPPPSYPTRMPACGQIPEARRMRGWSLSLAPASARWEIRLNLNPLPPAGHTEDCWTRNRSHQPRSRRSS